MRTTGKWIPAMAACLGIMSVFSAYLLWRNAGLRESLAAQERIAITLQAELDQLKLEHDALQRQRDALSAETGHLRIELQSLEDRASNLAAQRDHLRSEMERRAAHALELEAKADSMERELAESRLKGLQLEQLPGELEAKLEMARKRIAVLEEQVDNHASELSDVPQSFVYSGTSSDESVFSIEGKLPDMAAVPQKIFLLDAGGLILEGWIHKAVEGHLVGHTAKWHQSASALVKGQKVFMLPSKSHEMHH